MTMVLATDLDVKHEYYICNLDPDVSTNYSGSALPVPPDDLHELDLSWAPTNGEIRIDDLCWTQPGEDSGESSAFSEDCSAIQKVEVDDEEGCSANKENIGRCYYFAGKDFSGGGMVRKRQRSVRVRRRWDSKNGGGLRRCSHCQTAETPQWRMGPMGPRTLCNACGVRYKTGRLVAEYRPAKSPSFDVSKHSNFHKRIMKKKCLDLPRINCWVS